MNDKIQKSNLPEQNDDLIHKESSRCGGQVETESMEEGNIRSADLPPQGPKGKATNQDSESQPVDEMVGDAIGLLKITGRLESLVALQLKERQLFMHALYLHTER